MIESMGIQELARRTGVPAHTLRYYETAGLMIPVARDAARRRVYTGEHLKWVEFLLRLRESGMGIAQLREYVRLVQSDSPDHRAERLCILRKHRDEVRARIDRLTQHLDIIERKVEAGCAPEPGRSLVENDD